MVLVLGDLLVIAFSSMDSRMPIVVTIRADSFVIGGIVMVIMVVGGMFMIRINPAKMLPRAKRMIGLIRFGLFSLMGEVVEKRGSFNKAK